MAGRAVTGVDCCPRCGSDDLRSLARIEAGEIPGIDEDATIYHCRACDHEWDTAMSDPGATL